jgi:3-keto-5-aminohexanoate cleavage enzyme
MRHKLPERIMIAVAPVGKELDDPEVDNPLRPEAIAEQVIECAQAGATMVHLHVRDERGRPTADLTQFTRTLDLIRRESDIIIQGSTGGASNLSLEERCVSLDEPRVEVASLNMGSVNFGEGVYINTYPDIRYWAGRMRERKVLPELEVFDLSMMRTCRRFAEEGVLHMPFHFNFCLGFEGALPADAEMLAFLKSELTEGAAWGFIHDGMRDLRLHASALGLGASAIRVGFEDGTHYAPGRKARRNVELVARAVALTEAAGLEIADVRAARRSLGLSAEPKG